ncbi:MAG: hypothetical protein WBC51_04960 [Vicinamibacterales bacterium]
MAISVGSSSSSSSSSTGSLVWSHTTVAGTDMLVVTAGTGTSGPASGRTVTAVSFGAQSLTEVPSSAGDDGNFCRSAIWYLIAPNITTADITVTIGTSSQVAAGATNFSGVHQTVPFGTAAVNGGSSTTASVAVTAGSGEVTVGAIGSDSGSGITPTGTQLWEVENVNGDTSHAGQYYTTTNPTVQWGQAEDTGWAVSGVAMKAAAGGGGRVTKNTRAWPLGMAIGMYRGENGHCS